MLKSFLLLLCSISINIKLQYIGAGKIYIFLYLEFSKRFGEFRFNFPFEPRCFIRFHSFQKISCRPLFFSIFNFSDILFQIVDIKLIVSR